MDVDHAAALSGAKLAAVGLQPHVGIGLVGPGGTLIDSLSYEGPASGVFAGRTYVLTEGRPFMEPDNPSTPNRSIGRRPDGRDTDDNLVDLAVIPSSPGSVND